MMMMMRMRWRSDAAGGWAELGCCSGAASLQVAWHPHLQTVPDTAAEHMSLLATVFCAGRHTQHLVTVIVPNIWEARCGFVPSI
jgi:hypothetical protein